MLFEVEVTRDLIPHMKWWVTYQKANVLEDSP